MNDSSKYLTVTALTRYIKYKIDSDEHLRQVFLRGEISNFKSHTTGHLYFSLKDETSKINAIMFNTNAKKIEFKPADGMKVLIVGRISVYEATGNYQIYVDEMLEDDEEKKLTPEDMAAVLMAVDDMEGMKIFPVTNENIYKVFLKTVMSYIQDEETAKAAINFYLKNLSKKC